MKTILLSICSLFLLNTATNAQTGPSFNKKQQVQISKVLGKDFYPVFSEKGELLITKGSVGDVKALPGGGFSRSGIGSVAKNELIHRGWVLRSSKQILDAMQSQLGVERFQQLEKLVANPNTGLSFSKVEQSEIAQILGKEFSPVFSTQGELLITKGKISKVKALPGGGFSRAGVGSVAKNELVHRGWIYKSSRQILDDMRSKLGAERFQQLEKVLAQ